MAITIETVETAINTIQSGGQSVSVEGMSYTAANIDALIRLRAVLQKETLTTNGTRPAFRGCDFTNMGY